MNPSAAGVRRRQQVLIKKDAVVGKTRKLLGGRELHRYTTTLAPRPARPSRTHATSNGTGGPAQYHVANTYEQVVES